MLLYFRRKLIDTICERMKNVDSASTKEASCFCIGHCMDREYKSMFADQIFSEVSSGRFSTEKYNGIYSIIYYDTQTITFFSDSFNFSHLYYYMDENRLLISDRVDEIVNELKKENKKLTIDEYAWSDLFCYYYVMGNKTMFKEIKSLTLGEKISIDRATWTKKSEYNTWLQDIKVNTDWTLETAADAIVKQLENVFDRIVLQRKKENIIIPLSGGWDSRTIAALAAKREKENIVTYSTNLDEGTNAEEGYASKVAEFLGVKNFFVTLSENYYRDGIEQYAKDTDYFISMHLPFWNLAAAVEKEISSGVVFDGILGDTLLRGLAIPKVSENENSEELLDNCFEQMCYGKCEEFIPVFQSKAIKNNARASLKKELEQYDSNLRIVLLANRKRAISFVANRWQDTYPVICPFCDRGFIETALSFPVELVSKPEFYPVVMKRIYAGIEELPSTNDKLKPGTNQVPIYRLSEKNLNWLLEKITKNAQSASQMYDPILVRDFIETYRTKAYRTRYGSLDNILFYACWKERYADVLNSFSIFDIEKEKAVKESREEMATLEIIRPSERELMIQSWLDYYKNEKAGSRERDKMSVLLTMDVEGFPENDARSVHTAEDNLVERLYYGIGIGETVGTLERIVKDERIPFTFFVELYSEILKNGEWKELLQLCASNGNEAGLHNHGFSIYPQLAAELGLEFAGHSSVTGMEKIIEYGVDCFVDALGYEPTSYRAGSFEVHNGLLEILSNHGFKVDSSIDIARNASSRAYSTDRSSLYATTDIMELPVTAYMDIQAKHNVINRLDVNATPFKKKLELITRKLMAGDDYTMLLSHSWSFLNATKLPRISKLYHTDLSLNMWDELQYFIDFINRTGDCCFTTCKDFYEKKRIRKGIVSLYGKEREVCIGKQIDLKKINSITTNATINNYLDGVRINYKRISEINDYLQLYDNSFVKGPSEKYQEESRIVGKEKVTIFLTGSALKAQKVAVFFMQYDACNGTRVSSRSQTILLDADEKTLRIECPICEGAKAYKIALKLETALGERNVIKINAISLYQE